MSFDFEPWLVPNPTWHTWLDRMFLGLKDKWVDLGICEAILTSKSLAKANPCLIAALATFGQLPRTHLYLVRDICFPLCMICLPS